VSKGDDEKKLISDELHAFAAAMGVDMDEETSLHSDSGKRSVVLLVQALVSRGLYPTELFQISEAYLEAYSESPVYHDSPPPPQMNDILEMARSAGRDARSKERVRRAKSDTQ